MPSLCNICAGVDARNRQSTCIAAMESMQRLLAWHVIYSWDTSRMSCSGEHWHNRAISADCEDRRNLCLE